MKKRAKETKTRQVKRREIRALSWCSLLLCGTRKQRRWAKTQSRERIRLKNEGNKRKKASDENVSCSRLTSLPSARVGSASYILPLLPNRLGSARPKRRPRRKGFLRGGHNSKTS